MTKKQQTLYAFIIAMISVVGGIAGTSFTMGSESQRISGQLSMHDVAIENIKDDQITNKQDIKNDISDFTKILSDTVSELKEDISELTCVVGDLRTDVQVLKALMERMENDINRRSFEG